MKVKELIKILEQYDGGLEIKLIHKYIYGSYDAVDEYALKEENIKLPDDEGDMDLRFSNHLRCYIDRNVK